MAVSEGYRAYVMEQLGNTLDVRSRAMFGGIGVYSGDLFFALLSQDTLYFKVDDTTRPAYESAGSSPFRPYGDERSMAYFSVPADVLEDTDRLGEWASAALDVARRARAR